MTIFQNSVPLQLAFKEIWRNKVRFLTISAVIGLITLLVLFLAGLAEGLGNGNKEYIEKLNADLILFQEQADLSIGASQFGNSLMNDIARIPGVKSAGAIGNSGVFIDYDGLEEDFSATMFGVEPGKPGEIPAFEGRQLSSLRANEAIIDKTFATQTGLGVGDIFTVKSTQGTVDERYDLTVVGVSDGRQYFIQPSIVVPLLTWDRIRPKPNPNSGEGELVFNIVGVQLENPDDIVAMTAVIQNRLSSVEAVDRVTAYEASPGYSAQQSTLQTQQGFTLLIGVLVVGGFFQIQTLQKVAQIGMLKALGASNATVGIASTLQIILTNLFGVIMGGFGTLALAASLPAGIPIEFVGQQVTFAIVTLLLIGPLGGLISLRAALKVEPLTALGLAS